MFNIKIKKIFESDQIIQPTPLKKTEIKDEDFIKYLSAKPSDLNIMLARVASFVKNDKTVSKEELVNDIIKVLERTPSIRAIIGMAIKDEYHIYKGFPVRKGDPYENMPDANENLELKPSNLYIGWTTNIEKAKEDAIRYDLAKGEPIGGLLIDTHVDPSKILFDINAFINVVKSKKSLFDKYNSMATPGKVLSKTNTEFLATEAPAYYGMWEIITLNSVVSTRVSDKWIWNNDSGKKTVKWTAPVESQQQTPQPEKEQNVVQEKINKIFESYEVDENFPDIIDEGIFQGIQNAFSRMFGTSRGKMLKFLNDYVKFYDSEVKMLKNAIAYAELIDDNDPKRLNALKGLLNQSQENYKKASESYKNYSNKKEDYNVQPEQTPQEQQVDKQHAAMKANVLPQNKPTTGNPPDMNKILGI